MERLTHRVDGLLVSSTEDIIAHLADYENTGLTPEEIIKLNDFEHSQCAKLLAKNGELERENATLKTALKIIYKDYEDNSNRKIDSIKIYIEVAKDCVEFEKMMKGDKK